MKRSQLITALLVAAATAAGCGGSPATELTVTDLAGRERSPLEVEGAKAVVLLFVAPDCPISNAFAPEFNRICEEYSPKGVAFDLVYADSDVDVAAIREHLADFGYEVSGLLDFDHRLVDRVGATVTPEAAVLSPEGKLLYRGRIDDRYVDFGKLRAEPTTRDLRDALDAILAGRAPETPRTVAIGCFIPDVQGS